MLISIDGPSGAGKTQLAMSLMSMFEKSYAVRAEGDQWEPKKGTPASLIELINTLDAHKQKYLRLYKKAGYLPDGRTDTVFLQNLIRLVLIKNNPDIAETTHTFIDTFWDPFWMLERQYRDTYYQVITALLPPPEISIFLSARCKICLPRIKLRETPVEIKESEYAETDKRMFHFTEWGQKNIPGFVAIDAHKPLDQVLDDAVNVIRGYSNTGEARQKTKSVATPERKSYVSSDPWR